MLTFGIDAAYDCHYEGLFRGGDEEVERYDVGEVEGILAYLAGEALWDLAGCVREKVVDNSMMFLPVLKTSSCSVRVPQSMRMSRNVKGVLRPGDGICSISSCSPFTIHSHSSLQNRLVQFGKDATYACSAIVLVRQCSRCCVISSASGRPA